jgi:hypothetical protein
LLDAPPLEGERDSTQKKLFTKEYFFTLIDNRRLYGRCGVNKRERERERGKEEDEEGKVHTYVLCLSSRLCGASKCCCLKRNKHKSVKK